MNFGKVHDTIFRSGLPSETDLVYFRQELKINTIINFCTRTNVLVEQQLAKDLGFHYIHLPWSAHFYNLFLITYYWKISKSFLILVEDMKLHPILVHCHHGRERTGMMMVIYRIVVDKYTFKQAFDEMKSYGFKPHLHFTLVVFLWIYTMIHLFNIHILKTKKYPNVAKE